MDMGRFETCRKAHALLMGRIEEHQVRELIKTPRKIEHTQPPSPMLLQLILFLLLCQKVEHPSLQLYY